MAMNYPDNVFLRRVTTIRRSHSFSGRPHPRSGNIGNIPLILLAAGAGSASSHRFTSPRHRP